MITEEAYRFEESCQIPCGCRLLVFAHRDNTMRAIFTSNPKMIWCAKCGWVHLSQAEYDRLSKVVVFKRQLELPI